MRLQFRDNGRTVRRARDADTGPSNMGELGNGAPGKSANLNQARPSGSTSSKVVWGAADDYAEHVASYPPAHERDPSGGAYVTKEDADGFHVGFIPGVDYRGKLGAVSGVQMATMRRGQEVARPDVPGTADDQPYHGGEPRVQDPGAVVAGYVGRRLVGESPAGVQDGVALGAYANPALVKMNARARSTYAAGGQPATTTRDRNTTIKQLNAKARAAWAGRSV